MWLRGGAEVFATLSIRHFLLAALAALGVATVAGLGGLLMTFEAVRSSVERDTALLFEDEATANRFAGHVQRQQEAALRYALQPDPALADLFTTEGMRAHEEIRRYLFRGLTPEERRLVEQMRERHQVFEVRTRPIFFGAGGADLIPDHNEIEADLERFAALRNQRTLRLAVNYQQMWTRLYAASAVFAALLLIGLVVIAHSLGRRLADPLEALAGATARVGGGDFTTQVPVRGRDEIAHVAGSFNTMVSHLRAAEESARESEARYRTLFDRVPVGLYRTRPDGRLVEANPAFAGMLGFSAPEDIIGADVSSMYSDVAERQRWMEVIDSSSGVVDVDRAHRTPDGTIRWLRDSARAVRNEHGEVLYYEGAVQDISDRVNAEVALRESEARFRSLIENAADAVIVLSKSGAVLYQSPTVQRLLGHEASAFAAMRLLGLVHPEDQERARTFARALDSVGSALTVELRCRSATGQWRALRVTGTNRVADNHVGGYVINVADVTSERELEEQLLQAQKLEGIGRLAGGIAHDFNNLLTAIIGYTDTIQAAEDPARARDDLGEIRRAAERAAMLTQQLLAFSRRQPVNLRPVNLSAVVRDVDGMLRRLVGEHIQLVTRGGADAWIRADPGQLEQIIVNLVVNARDALPKGGTVRLEVSRLRITPTAAMPHPDLAPGMFVRLRVSDTGTGIRSDVLPHIFEPFFTTKGVGLGTGLGLSTVYGLARQFGGSVAVESTLGTGTTFDVLVPALDTAQADALGTRQGGVLDGAGNSGDRGRTGSLILLAEDEASVRALVERLLRRGGYRVITAVNGADALAHAAATEETIDLLVTDVVMPVMGGIELAEQLTSLRGPIRVIYMSGYTKDEVPLSADHGMTTFLEKPFSPAELLDAVVRLTATS